MSPSRGRRARRLSSHEMQSLVHEAYAFHYVCMNLGFDSEELFAGTAFIANLGSPTPSEAGGVGNWDPPSLCATVELHAQEKKFIYTLCPLVPGDDARFGRFWKEFAAGQPKRDRGELDRIVQATVVWKSKGTVLGALADKGFVFPAVAEEGESTKVKAESSGSGSDSGREPGAGSREPYVN